MLLPIADRLCVLRFAASFLWATSTSTSPSTRSSSTWHGSSACRGRRSRRSSRCWRLRRSPEQIDPTPSHLTSRPRCATWRYAPSHRTDASCRARWSSSTLLDELLPRAVARSALVGAELDLHGLRAPDLASRTRGSCGRDENSPMLRDVARRPCACHAVVSRNASLTALLAGDVGVEVGEDMYVVVVEQASRCSGRKRSRSSGLKKPDAMRSMTSRSSLVLLVDRARLGSRCAGGRAPRRSVRPKRKKFSAPTASRISMFAPSSVPMVSAPFIASFMLPVPDASLPAVEICSERSAAGMMRSASETR